MDTDKSQIRLEPIDIDALPVRPSFDVTGLEVSPYSYCCLDEVEYVNGYPAITEEEFLRVKLLESTWKDASARASQHAYSQAPQLWCRVNGLDLKSLQEADNAVPDFCNAGDLRYLRQCYPELSALTDGGIFWLFDAYSRGCCYSGHWIARRDDAFLFFLLGALASKTASQGLLHGEEAMGAGEMAAFAMLRGADVAPALEFSLACDRYNRAITALAWALADGMLLHRQIR